MFSTIFLLASVTVNPYQNQKSMTTKWNIVSVMMCLYVFTAYVLNNRLELGTKTHLSGENSVYCDTVPQLDLSYRISFRSGFKTQPPVDRRFRPVPGGCHCLEQ